MHMVGGSTGCLAQVVTDTFEVVQQSQYSAARESFSFIGFMSPNRFPHPPLGNHAYVKYQLTPRAHVKTVSDLTDDFHFGRCSGHNPQHTPSATRRMDCSTTLRTQRELSPCAILLSIIHAVSNFCNGHGHESNFFFFKYICGPNLWQPCDPCADGRVIYMAPCI